ncbi:membrane-spanning 4-domains subfamily A member 4A-like isoform X2 [Tachyglossus aculeatus]|uniref:membrane-spanning 4-domains subfamily A member 4A-like isoform X2 n=1 Tax=Tachyglossus aculeatus TaxID=9261 RepID=UPI0018F2B4D7|nr:membrane-spanning 4-domains subfamily A member 4A-like isoform X2 [Tachyglossus aculeatus]
MESQPMPNGVFISFTQPGSHILQPGQSVTSGSSNQPNGTLQKFLKGEPKVLGAFQILIALVTFSCGIIMITSSYLPYELLSGYSLCGSIFFIISGTLSIAAEKKTHKMLVQGSLAMNIISIIFSGSGIIVVSICLAIRPYSMHHESFIYGLFSVELILTILEFCITMSLSVYGCKAVCANSGQIVVYLSANSHGSGLASQESNYEPLTNPPPNYEELTSKK